jgi:hypothetical protein
MMPDVPPTTPPPLDDDAAFLRSLADSTGLIAVGGPVAQRETAARLRALADRIGGLAAKPAAADVAAVVARVRAELADKTMDDFAFCDETGTHGITFEDVRLLLDAFDDLGAPRIPDAVARLRVACALPGSVDAPHCVSCLCLHRAPMQRGKDTATGSVTWPEHLECWAAYAAIHPGGQGAERIAERGGFGYDEFVALLGRAPHTWQPGHVVWEAPVPAPAPDARTAEAPVVWRVADGEKTIAAFATREDAEQDMREWRMNGKDHYRVEPLYAHLSALDRPPQGAPRG